MTITIVSSDWLVPNRWSTNLGPRVAKLSIPELDVTYSVAKVILDQRSDAEIQGLARGLVQLIAPESNKGVAGVPLGFAFEPRIVFQLFNDGLTSEQAQGLTLLESMAIGGLIALNRACKLTEQVKPSGNALNACAAIASARACGEWLYMVRMQESGALYTNKLQPEQEVRAAVKAKVKQAKTLAAKKGWRKLNKPYKQKVFDFYDAHKLKFKSVAHATKEVFATETIDSDEIEHSTVYKWLLAYVKAQKQK